MVGGGGSGGFGLGVVLRLPCFLSSSSNNECPTGSLGLSPTGDISVLFLLFNKVCF